MKLQTFYLIGGHCSRSREDAQTIFNYFVANGLKPVKKIKNADLLCVYTCGGFNETEKSSMQMIQEMLKQKSSTAIVVVTGCLTKINPKALNHLNSIHIIDLDNLQNLDFLIQAKTPFQQIPDAGTIGRVPPLYTDQVFKSILDSRVDPNFIQNIPDSVKKLKNLYFKKIKELDTHKIYHIRVSRGCLGNCAYCSIKLAHGRLHSRSMEQIQHDVEVGLKKGYTIFKLIGQDIGCYGLEINTSIVELLKMFFTLPGEHKIIITDFHPRWLIKYYHQLEPLFCTYHEKILSIRIPIESGSNTILKRMRRQYTIEEVKQCISGLQKKIPSLKIYTHILIGFPGETDEDFQQTLKLVQELHFNSVGIYPYSDRPVTEAFTMSDKISSEVIEERMKQLKLLLYHIPRNKK